MCLVAISWQPGTRYPVVLASNRDEFHHRPSAPLSHWSRSGVLAGRDLQAGGTWLGLHAKGRLGVLTNVREPHAPAVEGPSRGSVVCNWLRSSEPWEVFAQTLRNTPMSGYNLLALDTQRESLHYVSNRAKEPNGMAPAALAPGLYTLSNAQLSTEWPKTQRLRLAMASTLAQQSPATWTGHLLSALRDTTPVPDEELPHTGVAWEWERALARIFIEMPERSYGTRCSTVVVAENSGRGNWEWTVVEQSWGPQGEALVRTTQHLQTPARQP